MVVIDPEGRLVRLAVVPPQVDPPSPNGFGGTGPAARARELEAAVRRRRTRPRAHSPRPSRSGRRALRGHPRRLDRISAGRARAAAARRGRRLSRQAGVLPPGRAVDDADPDAETIAERARVTWASAIAHAGRLLDHRSRRGAHRASQPAQGTRRPPRRLPARGVRLGRGVRRAGLLDAKHVADPNVRDEALLRQRSRSGPRACCGCSISRSSRTSGGSGRRRWCRGRD